MDALMKEEALELVSMGAQHTEVKDRRDPNAFYAYMKPTHLGPYWHQMRLDCKLQNFPSGKVVVETVGADIGSKEGKEVVFRSYEDQFFVTWENSISWKAQSTSKGVIITHLSKGHVRILLAWWFPLPDQLVKATLEAVIRLTLRDGQSKIAKKIKQRYTERFGAAQSTGR